MAFIGKPTNANELILWNGTNFYSGKLTGNNIDTTSTTPIQINGEFIGTSFGVNNGSTIPTLASGTGVPSSTPPDGSLFMRTDGTSSTGLYTYQSGTWVSVTGSSSFTAGGDLSGTSTDQTVIAIQGNAVQSGTLTSIDDGYVLTWVNASSQWQAKPTLTETITINGDVTGTTAASTVAAIQGNTVTPGALTKGQFFVATSTSNWAATNLSGDVSESATTPGQVTVAKVDGVSYPANPSTNTVPIVTSTNTVTYQQIANAQVSATAAISGSKINPNFGTQAIIGASLDTSTATTLYLGTSTANSIQIGTTGNTTTVLGNLTVNGAETIVGASTFQASSVFDGNVTVSDGYNFTVIGATGGTFSINGDGNSSVTTSSGSLTITSAAAATWSTSGGALNVSGFGGTNIQNNGTTHIAVGSSGVTIGTITDANSIVGSLQFTTRTASSSFVVDNTTTDMLIYANTSGGAFNITLPAPTNGRTLIIKDSTQSFATYNLTIVRHASENIDGIGASLVLATANEEVILTSDGTNWFTNLFASSTTGAAGGDLSGTYPNPTVAKINGSTVPAGGSLTTGNVLQVNGSSSLTYAAINLAGGANYITGNLPAGNFTPGTSGQVLMSNATPATTWTTFTGDVTVSATGGTTVNSISGSSPIAISAASVNFTGGTGNFQSSGTTIASVTANKFITTKGIRRNVTPVSTSTYTVLATDDIIAASPTSNTIGITLPTSPTTGDTYVIKDVTGNAATNNITITPSSGNIDGAANFIMDINYSSETIIYTGSMWSIV